MKTGIKPKGKPSAKLGENLSPFATTLQETYLHHLIHQIAFQGSKLQ
jgi:hypothetical protein